MYQDIVYFTLRCSHADTTVIRIFYHRITGICCVVRKTLCEATCKITVAQKSTRLSRAKYTALQQQHICPSTTEEPYTKLSMKLSDVQPWPESEPASSSQGLLGNCPNDEQHSYSSPSFTWSLSSDTTGKASEWELPADPNLPAISHRQSPERSCQAQCSSWLFRTHECSCHHQTTWKTTRCGCVCSCNHSCPSPLATAKTGGFRQQQCFWATSDETTC